MAISPSREGAAPRIFVSAGEASGDAYAAALVEALGRVCPSASQAVWEGIGGPRAATAGVNLIANSSRWGAMGVAQAIRIIPRVLRSYYRVKARLRQGRPGLFIPIDFGYMNIKLARHAKTHGWKVLYFVPPGSWKRDRQGEDLPRVTDAVVTPFSWSAEILQRMGANAHWFGHPIKQLVLKGRAGVDAHVERKQLAVLPGSRVHELEANLPILAATVKGLEFPIEFALAPSLDAAEITRRWRELSDQAAVFTVADTAGVLLRSRAALVCSGTATLEAALCACPMVVFYEMPKSGRLEIALLRIRRPKFIALPNILLDRFAVPEHIEKHGVSPDVLRRHLLEIWEDTEQRAAQLEAFRELDELLGPSDAIDRTAALACSLLS